MHVQTPTRSLPRWMLSIPTDQLRVAGLTWAGFPGSLNWARAHTGQPEHTLLTGSQELSRWPRSERAASAALAWPGQVQMKHICDEDPGAWKERRGRKLPLFVMLLYSVNFFLGAPALPGQLRPSMTNTCDMEREPKYPLRLLPPLGVFLLPSMAFIMHHRETLTMNEK